MDKENILYRIAVASSDGKVINRHFGKASVFRIFDVMADKSIQFVENREVEPVCQSGNHDDSKLRETIKLFSDCKYVLISRIGYSAQSLMEQEGIIPMELPGIIEESVQKLIVYEEIKNLLA